VRSGRRRAGNASWQVTEEVQRRHCRIAQDAQLGSPVDGRDGQIWRNLGAYLPVPS